MGSKESDLTNDQQYACMDLCESEGINNLLANYCPPQATPPPGGGGGGGGGTKPPTPPVTPIVGGDSTIKKSSAAPWILVGLAGIGLAVGAYYALGDKPKRNPAHQRASRAR
jgi:hypothetical protein